VWCHQSPDRGHERFTLGIQAGTCATCHEADDPHERLYAGLDCEVCHDTDAFDLATFGHPPDLLDGGPVPRTCASCHAADDPHRDQFEGRDCGSCHGTATYVIEAFDHAATRFSLDGAHETTPCAACHTTDRDGTAAFVRYRPLGFDCTDCHGEDR